MPVRLVKSRLPNLYRSENGTYYVRAMTEGKAVKRMLRSQDGQPVKNFSVARMMLSAELASLGNRKNGDPFSWESLCDDYLRKYKSRPELSPRTIDSKKHELSLAKNAFKGRNVDSITGRDLSHWWACFCMETRSNGLERSPRTKNRVLDTVQSLFKYAEGAGLISRAPAADMQHLHIPRSFKKLSPLREFRDVIESMRESYRKLKNIGSGEFDCHSSDMVEFMAYSGARIAEARLLKREDIGQDGVIIHGVKRSDDRFVPYNNGLRDVCDRLARFHEKNQRLPHEPVFLIHSPRKAFEHAVKKVGAPHCTMHGLRHFFITSCIEAGIVPAVIARWVGHKDGGVLIARTYTHVRDDYGKSEAAKLSF